MQDSITREITVKASGERVYQAITNPKQIITWFPDKIEGTLEVGSQPVMSFTEHNHQTRLFIEAADPHTYFAYRWVPGGYAELVADVQSVPNTLVEFFIEEVAGVTKVTLKESGFSSLPPAVAEESLKQNSGGWEYMMSRLEKVTNQ